MSGICPKCGRDYSSKSTVCRFCNCALIDRKSYNTPAQSQKQSAPQPDPQIPQKAPSSYSTFKKPVKKKKTSFISLLISILFCLIAISMLTSDDEKTTNKSKAPGKTNIEASKNLSKEDTIRMAVENIVGSENLEIFTYVPDTNYCVIKIRGSAKFTKEQDIIAILDVIIPMKETDVSFKATLLLYDIYGNETDDTIIQATFTNDTIQKTNFENVLSYNLRYIADEWWNDKYLDQNL